jgi:hypothetical protein
MPSRCTIFHSNILLGSKIIAKVDDPTCERCLQEDELATHILYGCEAVAYLRFRQLGQFFMEPSDYYDAPINKVLHFIQSEGLIKGSQKRKHNRSQKVAVQGPDYCGPPLMHSFIHIGKMCRHGGLK